MRIAILLLLLACQKEDTHCFQCTQTRQGKVITTFDKCMSDQEALNLESSMSSTVLDNTGTWIYTVTNCKKK